DLRGAGLRSVDADALGAAPDAAADVLRCGARAVLLRGALDPPVRRTRPAAPTHPAGPGTRRGRAGPRRGVTKLAPPLLESPRAAGRCCRRLCGVTDTDQRPVLVVDYGAQYSLLIARSVREARVYSEIVPHSMLVDRMLAARPRAIILSGG